MFRPHILSSSGSYKFGRRVQRIWQLVIGKWQTIHIYVYTQNTYTVYIIHLHIYIYIYILTRSFIHSSRAVNTNKTLPPLQVTTRYSYRHVLPWCSPKLGKIRIRLRHVATGGWKSSRWFDEDVLLNYGRNACEPGKGRKEEQKKTTGRRKAGKN